MTDAPTTLPQPTPPMLPLDFASATALLRYTLENNRDQTNVPMMVQVVLQEMKAVYERELLPGYSSPPKLWIKWFREIAEKFHLGGTGAKPNVAAVEKTLCLGAYAVGGIHGVLALYNIRAITPDYVAEFLLFPAVQEQWMQAIRTDATLQRLVATNKAVFVPLIPKQRLEIAKMAVRRDNRQVLAYYLTDERNDTDSLPSPQALRELGDEMVSRASTENQRISSTECFGWLLDQKQYSPLDFFHQQSLGAVVGSLLNSHDGKWQEFFGHPVPPKTIPAYEWVVPNLMGWEIDRAKQRACLAAYMNVLPVKSRPEAARAAFESYVKVAPVFPRAHDYELLTDIWHYMNCSDNPEAGIGAFHHRTKPQREFMVKALLEKPWIARFIAQHGEQPMMFMETRTGKSVVFAHVYRLFERVGLVAAGVAVSFAMNSVFSPAPKENPNLPAPAKTREVVPTDQPQSAVPISVPTEISMARYNAAQRSA